MEPEQCHVVFLNSIEFINPQNSNSVDSSPSDPLIYPSVNSTRIELPTCPVCLERMDSNVTGLLTIQCTHTFHCQCISKWGDGSCPVCRYTHQKFLSEEDSSSCAKCGTMSDLWICLICGNLGCGRYKSGHAQDHFNTSQHVYALEIETQRVWDYAGDGYVHRLLRNNEDGKLVELSASNSSNLILPNESQIAKQDSANNGDFATLLTTQLESQRHYFETLLSKTETIHIQEIGALTEKIDFMNLKQLELECKSNQLDHQIKKERKSNEKKSDKMTKLVDILKKELDEEKVLNQALLKDQEYYRAELTKKQEDIADLNEQVRDLMFYVDTIGKSNGSEIAGASIVME